MGRKIANYWSVESGMAITDFYNAFQAHLVSSVGQYNADHGMVSFFSHFMDSM